MTSYVTPKKNAAFIFYAGLPSVASANIFQANPTIAAGDFKVSIDGGALANLATLPAVTPASSKMVKFSLSADEMNGDNITIVGSDAAGGEWKDILVNIQTSARQIDDLCYPTVSGRSLDVSAGGEAGVDWANVGSPTTTVGLSGTTVKTATDVETDTADIQARLPAALTAGGNIKADALAISGDTVAADNAELFFENFVTSSVNDAGATTSAFISALTSAVDNFYVDSQIMFTSGALAGLVKPIYSYNGTTKVITFDEPCPSAPANGVTFAIVPIHTHTLTTLSTYAANQVWDTDATAHQTQGTFGQAIGDPAADTNTIYKAVVTDATGATVGADVVAIKAETVEILADTAEIGTAGAGLTNINLPNQTMDIVGNITGNLSGSVGSVTGAVGSVTGLTASNLDATISSRLASASYTAPPSAAANATAVLTTAMTESYAADGAAPTLAQAMFMTQQAMTEASVSGTTLTVKKLDGTTTAATFTLDSAVSPTSRTRAT